MMDVVVVRAMADLLKGYLFGMRRDDGNPVRHYLAAEVARLQAEERRLLALNRLEA
jgi:hypothetical protein